MRFCRVKGNNAIFHKWGEASEIISPSLMVGGHRGGELKYATAIVELENGQVLEVMASEIVFYDTKEQMDILQLG